MPRLSNRKKRLIQSALKMCEEKRRKKQALLGFKEDIIQDDSGDPSLSCQADVNKLAELKQKQTKSSDDQAQTIAVKNEPIDESEEPDVINQPINVNAEPIVDNVHLIDGFDQLIGEIGSHSGDADQPTDEEDNIERIVNQPINKSNQAIDELCQEECNLEKNILSERFYHIKVILHPLPDAVVETQCSGCLAVGAGEQAATMLEECFGIQAAGALLCGACAERLRAALRFKRAVVARHAQLTRHPPPCAGAPAAAIIKAEEDIPPKSDDCELSTVNEAPDDSESIEGSDIWPLADSESVEGSDIWPLADSESVEGSDIWPLAESESNIEGSDLKPVADCESNIEGSDIRPVADCESNIEGSNIRPDAQVKPDKIVKEPKKNETPGPKKYNRDRYAKKKAAEAYFTQLGNSYACNFCEDIVDFDDVLTHRHNFERLIQCPLCVMGFKSKKKLTKHKLDEHGVDDNRCNVCDKSFVALNVHMDSVHKLGVKSKCTECDFETYTPRNLKKHMLVHSGERKYKCQYCDKSFVRKNTCRYHERIHTGDKRKVCTECGQAFVQKASLNYHMAKYHPNVRY